MTIYKTIFGIGAGAFLLALGAGLGWSLRSTGSLPPMGIRYLELVRAEARGGDVGAAIRQLDLATRIDLERSAQLLPLLAAAAAAGGEADVEIDALQRWAAYAPDDPEPRARLAQRLAEPPPTAETVRQTEAARRPEGVRQAPDESGATDGGRDGDPTP